MFTPIIRIILVIFSLIASINFYSIEDFANMSIMLIVGGLLIYGYYKYGTVYTAFQHIKKNNLKNAEKLISKIQNPDKLTKGLKGYYYFTTGIIALEKKELEKSYSDLTLALSFGLRTENDKSIILLNLANIELLRNNFIKANEYIKKVKVLDLKPLVESETNKIEKEINVAQQNT